MLEYRHVARYIEQDMHGPFPKSIFSKFRQDVLYVGQDIHSPFPETILSNFKQELLYAKHDFLIGVHASPGLPQVVRELKVSNHSYQGLLLTADQ